MAVVYVLHENELGAQNLSKEIIALLAFLQ